MTGSLVCVPPSLLSRADEAIEIGLTLLQRMSPQMAHVRHDGA